MKTIVRRVTIACSDRENRLENLYLERRFIMNKKWFFIPLIIVLMGCATTANYEKILTSWVGTHADNLVSSWGPPQGSYTLSDGSAVIEYVQSRNVQGGGYTYTVPKTTYHYGSASAYGSGGSAYGTYSGYSTTYVNKTTPTYNIHKTCKTTFNVNSQGIITSWRWRGNACRALPPK